jgi:hypothetical protein
VGTNFTSRIWKTFQLPSSSRIGWTPPTPEPLWAAAFNRSYVLDEFSTAFRRTINGVYAATTTFTVEPRHTVSRHLIPTVPAEIALAEDKAVGYALPPHPRLVKRAEGYATIEVPMLRDRRGLAPFRPIPQMDRPVRVLLNPESTLSFVREVDQMIISDSKGRTQGYTGVDGYHVDAVEPVVPASGKAENEIVPFGLWSPARAEVAAMRTSGSEAFLDNAAPERDNRSLTRLLDQLCELDLDEGAVKELNAILDVNAASLRLRRFAR